MSDWIRAGRRHRRRIAALIFTACHPLLSREARAALALRMICGLTTEEIARAFLLPAATIGQRIVRAKRTLSESGLAYETPARAASERLASVLEVVYLIFNEATPRRARALAAPAALHEALRMGACSPRSRRTAEAHGLLALMELNARALRRAPTLPGADPVAEQNRALWDQLQIRRACCARAGQSWTARWLLRAAAAIIACTPRRARRRYRWPRISGLYARWRHHPLAGDRTQPRGGGRHGRGPRLRWRSLKPRAGARAQKLPSAGSVRGDLLHRLGRFEEARAAFEAARGSRATTGAGFAERRAAEAGMRRCPPRSTSTPHTRMPVLADDDMVVHGNPSGPRCR